MKVSFRRNFPTTLRLIQQNFHVASIQKGVFIQHRVTCGIPKTGNFSEKDVSDAVINKQKQMQQLKEV